MKKNLFVILISLLIICTLSACEFEENTYAIEMDERTDLAETSSFQEYLWEEHAIDLFIQIGLLLAGAFGVTALLPSADEE